MKKLLAIILTVLSLYSVFADDGGSYYPEEWTYGNIYVKEPNDKIALERELLFVGQGYFYGSSITALFDFKNTTSEKVTVPCAFPVIVSTQVAINKDGYISNYIPIGNSYRSKIDLINLALGKINATKEEFFAIDKKLRTLSIDEYLSEMKNNQITDPTLQPCVIEQDGKNVSVLMVGIETSIEKDIEASEAVKNSSWSEAEEVYTLKLVLHFYHELVFNPSASSKLTVKYDIDTLSRSYRGSKYNCIYDISTGGTWKGNINDFIVLTDSSMTAHNSNANFEVTGFYEPLAFYITQNYKPQKNEFFEFKLNYNPEYECYESIFHIPSVENEETLSFVTNVKASSELEGTYKMAGKPDMLYEEENQDKNLRTSTYKANTSFDGILFNGWVEGVKGDGIGEWIEFTLTTNVIGPFATNGLRRFNGAYKEMKEGYSKYDSWDFVFSKINFIGEPWISNNRIKSMTLFDSSGKTNIKLDFADIFPIFNDYISGLEAINSIKNPVFLEKGTYKMQIDSVYKGRKWDDTVLGEVWFIPVPEKLSQILENDTDLFFKKPITDIIQKSVLSNIEISERQTEEGFLGVTYSYDEFYYAINAENEITITGHYSFCSSILDIPSTIEGKIVTTIGKDAFEDCDSLKITIPDSVISIGDDAFEDCDSLTSITIPDSVTTIGDYAFSGCDSLISITIPNSVTTIGQSTFSFCDSLTSITIPDSVTTIGDYVFYDCDSLTSITIPDSVISIGEDAFFNCDLLTSITIPDSVTTIGDYAFCDCDSLTSITIPDSVTTIGDYAFYDCDSLTSITIPDSVISIGDDAFEDCDSLTSITIPDSVTIIGDYAFRNCDSLTSITIPDSVISIVDDAFRDCESITIQCNPGSYAEKYCKDNNLKCFIISD